MQTELDPRLEELMKKSFADGTYVAADDDRQPRLLYRPEFLEGPDKDDHLAILEDARKNGIRPEPRSA